jgi:CheY-like chemotaxis protein
MEKIFEPFFTTKEPGKGTGLGLVNVQQIIKGHGGFILVSSQIGIGTCFKVYLPAAIEKVESKPEVEKVAPSRSSGECILVVDDEADIRLVIQRSLDKNGYKPIMACDGAEAIALYAMQRNEIRAAVVDMIMPVMDGMTTIRTLRRYNPDLPIIAISGMVTPEVESGLQDLQIDAMLRKPFNTDALLERLRETLQRKTGKSAG